MAPPTAITQHTPPWFFTTHKGSQFSFKEHASGTHERRSLALTSNTQEKTYSLMIYRFIALCLMLSTVSCVPYRDLILFRKGESTLPEIQPTTVSKNTDVAIQPNDALSITVSCLDPQLAAPFNLIDTRTSTVIVADSPLASFLVDSNGDINYPVLGKIQATKKTIAQLRDTLTAKLRPYIKDPSINIRRVNFKITVLGEVTKAGSFSVPSERITILEAIGLAGDFTSYSDRQRVLVVREENGKVISVKIDLQTPDFFNSPFYFLHPNDVVYIDPKKGKTGTVNDPASKFVSWGSAAFSAIAAIATAILLLR
jgi:polysaccharide biosynthesis/export protein